MSVNIQLREPPVKGAPWSTKVDMTPAQRIERIPPSECPFVEAELGYIRGLFQGLAAGPIEGRVTLLLHENLCQVSGNLTVYDRQVHQSLHAVLRTGTWMAQGLAARYPKTEIRFEFRYTLTWREPTHLAASNGGD